MSKPLPVGKLPAPLLKQLLDQYTSHDDRILLGPAVGEDAAVIDFGDRLLIAKADPITFATDEIGWYAIHVNANDIACTGGVPKWFLATVLLPAGDADANMAERIFQQLSQAGNELGITLCGGHTEITYGLDRPIVAGLMLGEMAPGDLISTGGAQVGDSLLLTKGVAIEGTSIIAREKASELAEEFDEAFIRRCQAFLHDPGISVVRDAHILRHHATVHAMHDPTEGGLSTALYELAQAAGVGLEIDGERIPILPETQALCQRFELHPLGLIASGALLAALPARQADLAIRELQSAGILADIIGRVVPADRGVQLRRGDSLHILPAFERDEIARLFD